MDIRIPTLDEWDRLPENERLSWARIIEASALTPVRFQGLKKFDLGKQSRVIAQFTLGTETYSLVPGGRQWLGFDPGQFAPTALQLESYRQTADEYGMPHDIRAEVERVTTRMRECELLPMLVETAPREIGLESISPDDPEVRHLLSEHPQGVEVHKSLRVEKAGDGSVRAWRIRRTTHQQVLAHFQTTGFRLLTSDEWEYVCAAGSRALFRWGDDCPCDRYPTENSSAERRRKTEWALSGGTREYKPDPVAWVINRQPNAFGLMIAQSPYECEVVAEEGLVRGGDGGSSICGGVGFFMGWLPLASAYLDKESIGWLDADLSNLRVRRVIQL